MERFLAGLTARSPTDITSETSGFFEDVDFTASDFDDQLRTDRPVYDLTTTEKKGVLVIVNNTTFSSPATKRLGSDVDVTKLNQVFTNLGFEIQVAQNLMASQMVEFVHRGMRMFF